MCRAYKLMIVVSPHMVTILTHLTPSHTHTHPSPSGLSYEDTYNTLKYADRAKQIKTKVRTQFMCICTCMILYTVNILIHF